MSKPFPCEALIDWFEKEARNLPWREERSAYRVWVSEVMLQQTQVKTVIPYFERWMKRFPTIEALAGASEEEVIKQWEGLGYYSRARALLKGAATIISAYGGEMPKDKETLQKIPGLGPYTTSAILNFAFHQRSPLVDGNVMRVLSRFFALHEPIDNPKAQKRIWEIAGEILPRHRPWVFSEAMMELGATCCQKKPDCTCCPLKEECRAHKEGLCLILPHKERKITLTHLHRTVAVIVSLIDDAPCFLLKKESEKKLMKGLFDFPYLEEKIAEEDLEERFGGHTQLTLSLKKPLKKEKQSFTRFAVSLYPYLFFAKENKRGLLWKTAGELKKLALSSGHRRIADQLIELQDLMTHENICTMRVSENIAQ